MITDLNMPKLSGVGLLAAMRSDPRTVAIPVIVLSCMGDAPHMMEALKMGAVYYLTKPVRIELLVASIERILRARR